MNFPVAFPPYSHYNNLVATVWQQPFSRSYVIYNKDKVLFDDWLKIAPTEELEDAYDKLRLEKFYKTGDKPYEMERISQVLGERGAKEWFENHPPNLDPNFRWTDVNRWENG